TGTVAEVSQDFPGVRGVRHRGDGTRVLGQGRKEASRLRIVLPGVVVLYIISRNPSESVKNPIMLNRIKTVFEPGVDPRTRIQTQTTLARLQLDLIDVYVKYAVEYAK